MRTSLLVALAAVAALPSLAVAAPGVPYHDDRVAGHLAFCDGHGRALTGGPLTDAPFAAKVVSDVVPPGADDPQTGAFVLAYQPRQGVAPGAWSGEQLTASSTYTDRRHPSAEVTYGDVTLLQASQDYPPQWDGLLQLRMYTKAPQQPVYSARYAAADVRITGGRWQVVDPVALPCTSGTATSVARVLAPESVASPRPSGRPAQAAARATAPSPSPTARAGSQAPAATGRQTAEQGPHGTGGGSRWVLPVSLLAVALAAGGGLLGWRRLNSS